MKFELTPYHRNMPDSELLDDLRRVAADMSVQSLTQADYDKRGKFSAATFKTRFRTWNNALLAAGLVLSKRMNIASDELLTDVRRVATLVGKTTLTQAEYDQHGFFSSNAVCRRFGSWEKSLKLLELEPGWVSISTEELFDNLERVWRHLGRQPTVDEMVAPLSRFNGGTYKRRFGGYRKALEAFVASIDGEKQPPQVTTDEQATELVVAKAQDRSTPRAVNWRLRFLALRRDGFRCRACGRSPANVTGVELEVDHIVAWSNGGETVLENLQALCTECNGGKSNLDWMSPPPSVGELGEN